MMARTTPHEKPHVRDAQFAGDVQEYLARNPRQLPSRYLYDPLGSALFDAICHLPWYPITRAESRLLASHGGDLLRRVEPLSNVIELGPGNGEKLKLLLEAAGPGRAPLDLHLVDVSSDALEAASHNLAVLPDVRIVPHAAEYGPGLRQASRAKGAGRTLVLFLGSNLGNFDLPGAFDFLGLIRENLSEGDALLLGTDLVKPERELLLAYDDPLGVTAAFNRNLLVRINTELGGNFALEQFAHQAVWNRAESRVEIYLVARAPQHVRIAALPMEFTMQAGERIWTESSYKYAPDDVPAMLETTGFRTVAQKIDERERFALTLAEV